MVGVGPDRKRRLDPGRDAEPVVLVDDSRRPSRLASPPRRIYVRLARRAGSPDSQPSPLLGLLRRHEIGPGHRQRIGGQRDGALMRVRAYVEDVRWEFARSLTPDRGASQIVQAGLVRLIENHHSAGITNPADGVRAARRRLGELAKQVY